MKVVILRPEKERNSFKLTHFRMIMNNQMKRDYPHEEGEEEKEEVSEESRKRQRLKNYELPANIHTTVEDDTSDQDYFLIASNVTKSKALEFLELNPSLHPKNVLLVNGRLLVLREEFTMSPMHSSIQTAIVSSIMAQRGNIQGTKLFPRVKGNVFGPNEKFGCSDIIVKTMQRIQVNSAMPCVVIEVSYSTGIRKYLNRVAHFLDNPQTACGYVFAVKYPWSSILNEHNPNQRLYDLTDGYAVCISITRDHHHDGHPRVSDVVSFGSALTAQDQQDIRREVATSILAGAGEFNPATIRGNVENYPQAQLCNAIGLAPFLLRIPGQMFLVNNWIKEDGTFAEAAVNAIDANVGEVVLDLFSIKEDMLASAAEMNAEIIIAPAIEQVPAVIPKW